MRDFIELFKIVNNTNNNVNFISSVLVIKNFFKATLYNFNIFVLSYLEHNEK